MTQAANSDAANRDWVRQAVFWQIYPLGFLGAEAEARGDAGVVHRLGDLHAWLDYAADLGASALLLGPVFTSSSHGYDTIDHFRIDPRLGDEADFDALIDAARKRGLRVVLDGVFNHVGRAFPAFEQVLREGPSAASASWFRLTWPQIFHPGVEPHYADFEGHRALVTLNHDEPAVADYVARVMNHWLDRGVAGWRLDAAYAVPAHFWASVLPRVRARHPGAYLFGEVIRGDYACIVAATGFDAVTQYELWKSIWSSLQDHNFFELAWTLQRHNGFLDSFVPQTFIGNHDVTRLASRISDTRHLPHALVILMTCGGTPSIYAGDEQGFVGVKENRPGGDDAIRPTFPRTPAELAPEGEPLYRLHRALIALRHRHPWLHEARVKPLATMNETLCYEVAANTQRLFVALSLADKTVSLPAPGTRKVGAGEAALLHPGTPGTVVELPPHGWAILEF
jgi:cyclomaltodextrinase